MGILYSSLKFLLFGKPKRHCMDNLNFLLPTERERERLVWYTYQIGNSQNNI